MNKLWTRDFTIITLGTVVSMLGNAVSGFAIGLLVLDYQQSTFLYALFMVVYSLPRLIVPLVAGPYIDRYSRKRIIYSLDFLSAALYFCIAMALGRGWFNYPALLAVSVLVGSIDSAYTVAYESLYPTLISEGNFTKAYSISSLMYPVASAMVVPLAGAFYESVGLAPLFFFNAATFLVAAVFETQIRAPEAHVAAQDGRFNLSRYRENLREGLRYLRAERGLMAVTAYFFCSMFLSGAHSTLTLPYFKATASLGVQRYTYVMGASLIGRLVGGLLHYRFRLPTNQKFRIAVCVYFAYALTEGGYLFLSHRGMMAAMFVGGLLAVNSYNIRISATQNYVPNDKRGRFNGIFQMVTMAGSIAGQLICGALGEALPARLVIAAAGALNIAAVCLILAPRRADVARIYNRQA